jgi:hypothetical protein
VITRPDQFVGATIYTGNQSVRTISTGNAPDLVWIKDRTQAHNHQLLDTVRGAPKIIQSDTISAEITDSTDSLTSFNSNGFTLGANALGSQNYEFNKTGNNYVAWSWKAGGNKNTFNVDDVGYASAAAAGLTAGDTTIAGASVGTKQGFSIIKYTGPNDTNNHEVPHGLSQAPNFIITKNLDTTFNWDIYHSSLADDAYLIFTNAATRSTGFNGRPTSTVFKTEHDYSTNENQEYISYCWHDVPGLQKFGTFEGNGNANGPFVELGFRPSIILTKNIDNYGTNYDWCIYDNTRSTFNPNNKFLCPNLSYQENYRGDNTADNARDVDFLSNGFKIRNNSSPMNLNAHTILYAAWAEAPTFNLFGGQSNAR